MTDPTTGHSAAQSGQHPAIEEPPADEHGRVERQAVEAAEVRRASSLSRFLNTSAGRNAGLILALIVLGVIGVATAGGGMVLPPVIVTPKPPGRPCPTIGAGGGST